MRKILVKVWQGELSPGQALNLLQDEQLIRDGPNIRFWPRELDDQVLNILEALREKAITVNEAEEEIEEGKKWTRTKRKARKAKIQQEQSCCA